jgi:biotin operon repressor
MGPSIPQNMTATVRAEYAQVRVPLIQRLLDELRRRAQLTTTTLQVSHRPLAAALGCSAAMLPRLMRQLEADGYIARTSYKNGYLIELIDQPGDRSPAVIDHSIDQATPKRQDAPKPSATRLRESRAYKEESKSLGERESRARESFGEATLHAWEDAGVYPHVLPQFLADCPQITLAQFRAYVTQVAQLDWVTDAPGLVITRLRAGLPMPTARTQARQAPQKRTPRQDEGEARSAEEIIRDIRASGWALYGEEHRHDISTTGWVAATGRVGQRDEPPPLAAGWSYL